MSFKYQAYKASEGHYVLTKGVKAEIHAFLSDELYAASEEEAWVQAVNTANLPGVTKIVLTPDLHSGFGVPIGCVATTDKTLLPSFSGFDIGCGMVQLKTNLTLDQVSDKAKRRRWIDQVCANIGLGVGQSGSTKPNVPFSEIVRFGAKALGAENENTERSFIPVNINVKEPERALAKSNQLGSLGSGNHFCQLDFDDKTNEIWAMIHTGSRGYGYQIATEYFNKGAEALGIKNKDLVWFDRDSDLGKTYWNLHNMAANFAIGNRVLIGRAVCNALMDVFGGEAEIFYEISHNLIQEEDGQLVHRKGATRAFPKNHPSLKGTKWETTGHPILIPGSMYTGSAILYAEPGAVASAYSVNHGSGRLMSRGQAKRSLDQVAIDKQMSDADILINTRNTPIDESGSCYKDLDQVLATVEMAGLAKVVTRLRPVACIKSAD
jgi:tRNA-splicing ligase RtcB